MAAKPELLADLKEAAGSPGPALVLAVGSPPMALLRPVASKPGRQSANDIALLTKWRNANRKAFLTDFLATEDRTSRWLADSVAPDNGRILFMIDLPDGRTVGYMGLAFIDWSRGYGEADSIVKGEATEPGLASACLGSLIDWARGSLGLARIGVRVRSDNPALRFYEKLGFKELSRRALESHVVGDMVSMREVEDMPANGLALVHMEYMP